MRDFIHTKMLSTSSKRCSEILDLFQPSVAFHKETSKTND